MTTGHKRRVFRAMRESSDGKPEIGPTARTLGVRPAIDIPVQHDKVHPDTGGLSVAPDLPENLPVHRRPPEFGGTGKDSVWSLDLDALGQKLRFRQDQPTHGQIEPTVTMSFEDYQESNCRDSVSVEESPMNRQMQGELQTALAGRTSAAGAASISCGAYKDRGASREDVQNAPRIVASGGPE